MRFLIAALAFSAVNALPQPQAAPSSAPAPINNDALIAELKTAPTAIRRFRELLTNAGKELLTGADLIKATVFDFNKGAQPFGGTQGGVTGVVRPANPLYPVPCLHEKLTMTTE